MINVDAERFTFASHVQPFATDVYIEEDRDFDNRSTSDITHRDLERLIITYLTFGSPRYVPVNRRVGVTPTRLWSFSEEFMESVVETYVDRLQGILRSLGREGRVGARAGESWISSAKAVIGQLRSLPGNWNQADGLPSDAESSANMASVLEAAAEFMPKPFLYPSPHGGVIAEFEFRAGLVTLVMDQSRAWIALAQNGQVESANYDVSRNGEDLFACLRKFADLAQ
jgi:hypothetical protein